ncbi:site-specific DNA-methyltransferase [Rhizobium leguminosarum]|uniref:DNA methyltransferase n=1 Tax=Rhizobium leguminosarum TaxID=384 RepID=UPI001C97E523|nr:DNA methyltransferase [Rhizobium leguminosarum]MBY5572203.1 site-specific DNA-methyltransferase [Rhizobium leguminosarum]MBY5578808.1 site-specific DNA-methyltransferase [Rhizobium leguminosarum]
MSDTLVIGSPKRALASRTRWEGFFPYYAGFPENFASRIIDTADLSKGAVVLDPWNGSGTTTYAATTLGIRSIGLDINPVMVIVAKSRLLPASEADTLQALAATIARGFRVRKGQPDELDDELLNWFRPEGANVVRTLEKRIRQHVVGERAMHGSTLPLENMSSLAATMYVALFAVCRELTAKFRSSNPTWLKIPVGSDKIDLSRSALVRSFVKAVTSMAEALQASEHRLEFGRADLMVADSTSNRLPAGSVDFILTSPPYCTRIDYSAATRVELALLRPILNISMKELGRKMIGTTRVQSAITEINPNWGNTCTDFLNKVMTHNSKASSGYYLKTHIDYFDKMYRSISNISHCLKDGGKAILVVQDSYYKDVHNNLQLTLQEMAASLGMPLRRREDFAVARSMSGINRYARKRAPTLKEVESVLCFEKAGPLMSNCGVLIQS